MTIPQENTQSTVDELEKVVPEQIQQTIATLKQDLPLLFERDIAYEIYAPDIYFTDPVNTFKGKFNYRIIYWTLRFHGQLFFTDIALDLHDIAQTAPDCIEAHWTVRRKLRLPWEPQIYFNGTSNYSLNANGLIDKHVDTWDRPPIEVLKQFFQRGQTAED